MSHFVKALAAGATILLLGAGAPRESAVPVTVFFGQVTDPTGDAHRSPFDPSSAPAPDLVYASALAADGTLDLSVRFAPGTFAGDTMVAIDLDTDVNPATGFPGTTSNRVFDADVLGVEYVLVTEGFNFGDKAKLYLYTGDPITIFSVVADDLQITFLEDGVDVSVPLALLGDDDGRLHFKATTSVQISLISSHGISDWITDVGLQPGSTVPADEEIADLDDALADLDAEGTLTGGPSRALSNHLNNALRALEAGHANAARAQLEAFIAQVQDLVDDGTLTEEEAAPLIGAAERALAGL